jgi:hypothetical protein
VKTKNNRTKCLNCGNDYKGNYCPQCGQKASTSRLHLKGLITNVITTFVAGENNFIHTLKSLCTRPGYMIREFILGKRISYVAPIKMLIYLVTFYALFSYITGKDNSFYQEVEEKYEIITQDEDSNDEDFDEEVEETVQQTMSLLQVFLSNKVYHALTNAFFFVIPYRIYFRKRKLERPDGMMQELNIAEHFYTMIYQSCLMMLFAIAILPLSHIVKIEEWASFIFRNTLSVIFYIIIYKQLLKISWKRSITTNIAAYITCIIIFYILITALLGSIILVINLMH